MTVGGEYVDRDDESGPFLVDTDSADGQAQRTGSADSFENHDSSWWHSDSAAADDEIFTNAPAAAGPVFSNASANDSDHPTAIRSRYPDIEAPEARSAPEAFTGYRTVDTDEEPGDGEHALWGVDSDGDHGPQVGVRPPAFSHPAAPSARHGTAAPASEDDESGDFVDDFLNDLDASPPPSLALEKGIPAALHPPGPGNSPLFRSSRAVSEQFQPQDGRVQALQRAGAANGDRGPAAGDRPFAMADAATGRADVGDGRTGALRGRGKPAVILALGLLLVVLLASGAYGVLRQRHALQEEIRNLQASLATAVSREEVQALRQQDRREDQLAMASLRVQVQSLVEENGALEERLTGIAAGIDEHLAAARAEGVEAGTAEGYAEGLAEGRAEGFASGLAERSDPVAVGAVLQVEGEQTQTVPGGAGDASGVNEDAGRISEGPWFVNFGSYARRPMAERWAGRLSVASGEVVVETASSAGKPLFRVRVIGLASEGAARQVAASLEDDHGLPALWIGRSQSS